MHIVLPFGIINIIIILRHLNCRVVSAECRIDAR